MNEPVISREAIAKQADAAALRTVRTGLPPPNPYPADSEAAKAWKASLHRYLLLHSSEECEGSA